MFINSNFHNYLLYIYILYILYLSSICLSVSTKYINYLMINLYLKNDLPEYGNPINKSNKNV